MAPLVPLEEAQARLLQLAHRCSSHVIETQKASGHYLAGPLSARRTQPSADLSAMDGFAVSGSGPWKVLGESRAGSPFEGNLPPGHAVHISTGAIVPAGADRILIQENAALTGSALTATETPPSGAHIRPCGFDFSAGDELLRSGQLIGPAQIALALSAGHGELRVQRKPVVHLIEGGDELVADPSACTGNQTPAVNNAMIAAMIGAAAGSVTAHGPVADDPDQLIQAFEQASSADVIITSGGASVGAHDHIRPALERWGAEIDFWRVAIRPGKPLMVARKDRTIILGLPGNPVSSFVTGFLFALPLVRHMAGAAHTLPSAMAAKLTEPLPANGPRRQFLRAIWDGASVRPLSTQDSSALRSLSAANALIERKEHCGETKAGTDVPVYLLQNGGIA